MADSPHTASPVTLVIPHHGDAGRTRALVSQLLTQASHQLVVVDDASPMPFPDTEGVTVIRRDINGGFGAAVNTGARAATGDLLLILNSDLEIGPTFVADLVAASAPWQPAVTGPAVVGHDGAHQWTGRHFPTTAHQVTEWLTPLARFRGTDRWHAGVGHDLACRPGVTTPTDWLVGAALLLPRQAFLDVGGFDERFHMNAEEVDLQRRLRARGIPSVYIGTVSVTHEGGGSSDPAKRRRWLVESRFRYAAKWGGERRLRTALRAATGINLGVNLARRAAGREAVHPIAIAREEWALTREGRR